MADDVGAVFSSHNDALVKLFDAHRGLPQSFGLDGAFNRMRLLFLQSPVVLSRSMIEKRLLNASKRPYEIQDRPRPTRREQTELRRRSSAPGR